MLNKRCTRRCDYCYGLPHLGEDTEYSLNSLLQYIDKYDSIGQLVFFGGEPLLSFDIIQSVVTNTRNVKRYLISTNGDLLTPDILSYLLHKGVEIQYSINDITDIKFINKNILYHITLGDDELPKLIMISKLIPNNVRIWVSLDRYLANAHLISDLRELRDDDFETYLKCLSMFRYVEDVGKECLGSSNNALIYDPSTNLESRCADYLLNGLNYDGIHDECLACNVEFCTACICRNSKNDLTHSNICQIYKFIKEEKIKYEV